MNTVSLPESGGLVAVVDGSKVTKIPEELYIPPDALVVFLESFEGPLDLLLYLIRRQDFDILTLPMAKIAEQYMGYVEKMQPTATRRRFGVSGDGGDACRNQVASLAATFSHG